jgi:demethylmenaquinone methyltransferase / 2-methoxy-6-polyprenyl-1,4-benzoquinol methylase
MSGALESPRDLRAMFDRIAPRYDLINRIMTAGRDEVWRKKAAREAVHGTTKARVLDVGTGTGELAYALSEAGAGFVVGVDFSSRMIEVAAKRASNQPYSRFLIGNGLRLPFVDCAFDACTVSFGLRNMADFDCALRELHRVICPGGRLVCLELTPMNRPVIGRLFNACFSRMAPLVGGLLSGDRTAYEYLPRSVANFMDAEQLAEKIEQAGFVDVRFRLFALGTIAIHTAQRHAIPNPPRRRKFAIADESNAQAGQASGRLAGWQVGRQKCWRAQAMQ